MPSPVELLTNEAKVLRQMVEGMDGEMIQAAVRREALLWVIRAIECQLKFLETVDVEPSQEEFAFMSEEA